MCLKQTMVFIEADECKCNIHNASRIITTGVNRVLVKNIAFATNNSTYNGMTCETTRLTKYVIECNEDDDHNYASSPISVAIMVFCLFLIFLTIYFLTKWQNEKEITKDMKRDYERQIEELKKPDGNKSEVIKT